MKDAQPLDFISARQAARFYKRLCRNAEALMQPPDHLERKWPSAIEYLVHAISAADEGDEITWL